MNKRIPFLLIALLPFASLRAQEPRIPDNDAIRLEITNVASPHFYPILMQRYMNGDRALTQDDYFYLYYGYAFQDSYRPLDPVPGITEIMSIVARSPEPDSLQCLKILEYGRQVMTRDPFSPTNLNMMAYVQTILGDTVAAITNSIRLTKIIETIKSTGTGLAERSSWVVIAFSHADDVLGSMGLQIAKRSVISRTVEYLDIGVRDQKIKGYYFDYSRVYWVKPEVIPDRRSQGLQINGITVR